MALLILIISVIINNFWLLYLLIPNVSVLNLFYTLKKTKPVTEKHPPVPYPEPDHLI